MRSMMQVLLTENQLVLLKHDRSNMIDFDKELEPVNKSFHKLNTTVLSNSNHEVNSHKQTVNNLISSFSKEETSQINMNIMTKLYGISDLDPAAVEESRVNLTQGSSLKFATSLRLT